MGDVRCVGIRPDFDPRLTSEFVTTAADVGEASPARNAGLSFALNARARRLKLGGQLLDAGARDVAIGIG